MHEDIIKPPQVLSWADLIRHQPSQEQQPIAKDVLVQQLANYNIPHFMMEEVAKKCGSPLAEKGKPASRLGSMNESALLLLHKIFVQCQEDRDGKFSDYRFAVFVASKVYSKALLNQSLRGKSGATHKLKVALFDNHGLVAVGDNKPKGEKVTAGELIRFMDVVRDIAGSKEGQSVMYAFHGSSVGYEKNFSKAFARKGKTKTYLDKYGQVIARTVSLVEFKDTNTNQIFSTPF